MTDTMVDVLRGGHIAGGTLALICGYSALMVQRGGPRHRLFGRLYALGMLVVTLSAYPLAILRPNPFLFGIMIFVNYFLYVGWASARSRDGESFHLDVVAALALLFGGLAVLAFLFVPGLRPLGFSTDQATVMSVFATIAIANAGLDLAELRRGPVRGKRRIARHVTGMCASLIATTTAVLITIGGRTGIVPELVLWLGPTLVLTPVIIYWTRAIHAGTFRY